MSKRKEWLKKVFAGALTVALVGTGVPFSTRTVEAAPSVAQKTAQETAEEEISVETKVVNIRVIRKIEMYGRKWLWFQKEMDGLHMPLKVLPEPVCIV